MMIEYGYMKLAHVWKYGGAVSAAQAGNAAALNTTSAPIQADGALPVRRHTPTTATLSATTSASSPATSAGSR